MSIVTNVTQILFSVHCNIHQHQYQYLKSDESQKCRYSCALSLFIIDKQKITHRLYVFNVVFLSFGPLSLFWFRLIFLYHAVIACPIPISDNLLSNVSCFSARWLVATMVTRAFFSRAVCRLFTLTHLLEHLFLFAKHSNGHKNTINTPKSKKQSERKNIWEKSILCTFERL